LFNIVLEVRIESIHKAVAIGIVFPEIRRTYDYDVLRIIGLMHCFIIDAENVENVLFQQAVYQFSFPYC
jgi:hypothetical protein